VLLVTSSPSSRGRVTLAGWSHDSPYTGERDSQATLIHGMAQLRRRLYITHHLLSTIRMSSMDYLHMARDHKALAVSDPPTGRGPDERPVHPDAARKVTAETRS
jgi:hypothetical protein